MIMRRIAASALPVSMINMLLLIMVMLYCSGGSSVKLLGRYLIHPIVVFMWEVS